jgi:thioredoxin-dependent peroxiredoxin
MTNVVRLLSVGIVIGASMLGAMAAAAGDAPEATPAADRVTTPAAAPAATPAPATTETPAAAPAQVMKPAVTAVPKEGTVATGFSLMSGEGKATSLKDYHGKWVVLYFYPKDFTGGCTLEAHNFQADQAKYDKMDAVVLGVSVDTPQSHKDFCAKEQLTFKLLSDPDAKVSQQYGSLMDYQGMKLSARNTFIIDPQGKIAKVFTRVNPTAHSEEVLKALDELQESQHKAQQE